MCTSAITGAGVALARSVGALATAPNALAATDIGSAEAEPAHDGHHGVGYGALVPDPNRILALPAGFTYSPRTPPPPTACSTAGPRRRGFRHGRGKLRTLADDVGRLQAFKCFDSGGRFVDDLSRATKTGTVYGVDLGGRPRP